jgi:sugar lactone lactonase YvrE
MGGPGADAGQFDVPHGLALDSRGFLYVCDTMNDRIQKFDVPSV